MRDQTLLYWGMVVTIFVLIAGMLTARELIEMYFEKRRKNPEAKHGQGPGAT
jgi:hypothetical protein